MVELYNEYHPNAKTTIEAEHSFWRNPNNTGVNAIAGAPGELSAEAVKAWCQQHGVTMTQSNPDSLPQAPHHFLQQ
jgi:hypothetical protein